MLRTLATVALLLVLGSSERAAADAIVVSQAMLASTIAEYFVEGDSVRVELEIGGADLDAFRDLMPDEVYERLGHEPSPHAERLARFFAQQLVIQADDGAPLPGRVLEMRPRERQLRDEITGEPLPAKASARRPTSGDEGSDADAAAAPETVVFASLVYTLPANAATLTLSASLPRPASIGFVAYHNDIPVNDFRYLSPRQTLTLDHEDPWYTRFERRALQRRYFEPMSGFLYVEPFEVRKEIVARPRDLQGFVDLGLEGRDDIPVAMQAELKRRVAEFLRDHQRVEIDGVAVPGELARVNFLQRSLRTSRVIDPPEPLDLDSAILGVIFVYPTDGLPQRVTMEWDLWNERMQRVPVSAVDQAGGLPSTLEPDWRVLEWQNFLKQPELPTLTEITLPPGAMTRTLEVARWVMLPILAILAFTTARSLRREARPGLLPGATAAVALLTLLAFAWARGAQIDDRRAGAIVGGLLHNVYRAFDHRDEARIYDVLAHSVSGDLLADIYLEMRRGLELASQGGARAKVKNVEVIDIKATPAEGHAFVATTTWRVGGSVGHWGHLHQRKNQYRAELAVEPIDGVWKLVDLEILEEERI